LAVRAGGGTVVLVWWTKQRRAQRAAARGQREVEQERSRWDANAIEAAGLRARLRGRQGQAEVDAAETAEITRWKRLAAVRPLVVEAARCAEAHERLAVALRSGR
jgi:hypothetical protein